MNQPPLLPGALDGATLRTLGVMGGGQLGRMFVHAAQSMGFRTAVLDPDPASPAGLVSHLHIATPYLDAEGLDRLAQSCAAITTEFENVPAPALERLALARPVAPGAQAVAIAQDRHAEKTHFLRCGVPCAPFAWVDSPQALAAVQATLLPGILKTCRMGYDGKGQSRVANREELLAAWDRLGRVPCVLEQRLPLAQECSVVLARGWDGHMVHFAPTLNLHREGILAVTEAGGDVLPPATADQAVQAARTLAEGLGYVGVLCVEFFVLQAGSAEARQLGALVVNEIAPRPHNSGHHTLDSCDQSQFELQVRTLAGLPLVQPRQHSAAVMLNLLGDLWPDGGSPPWDQVLSLPGAHLHLYGKQRALPGRKMGHITLTGDDPQAVRRTALQAAAVLGIEAF